MYDEYCPSDDEIACGLRRRDPALDHIGDCERLLRAHLRHVDLAAQPNPKVGPVGPYLMRRIADARTMRVAVKRLRRNGWTSPGTSDFHLLDLQQSEVWGLCRQLSTAVRENIYEPGPERLVRVPKPGKPGKFRNLTIQSMPDRVVGKATQLILEPVVDRTFSALSFGFRPGRHRMHALSTAMELAASQNRWFWVCADIANAFDNVPLCRLLDACRRHFPEDVVTFIHTLASTGKTRGMRQGSPLSPLLFNVFGDRSIDQPWMRDHPDVPLLRYADDILLLARSADEAGMAAEALAKLAISAGTPLKPEIEIPDIISGDAVLWLGFQMQWDSSQMICRIGQRAWDKLELKLATAHALPFPPLRAVRSINGWIAQMGPAYEFEDRAAVLDRIRTMAAGQSFEELPTPADLLSRWSDADRRWQRIRTEVQRRLPGAPARE